MPPPHLDPKLQLLSELAAPAANREPAPGQEFGERELFEIWVLKVAHCPKRHVHEWSTCPFAHDSEKARRRCPRTFKYTAIACPNMKAEGRCSLGEGCPFAHNDFEYWLHPERYHTCLCKQGEACTRKVCFFAHTKSELRTPTQRPRVPPGSVSAAAMALRQQQQAQQGGAAAAKPASRSVSSIGSSPRTSFDSITAACPGANGDASSVLSMMDGRFSGVGASGGGSSSCSLDYVLEVLQGQGSLGKAGLGGLAAARGGRGSLDLNMLSTLCCSASNPAIAVPEGAMTLAPPQSPTCFPGQDCPRPPPVAPLPAFPKTAVPGSAGADVRALMRTVSKELGQGRMDAATATTILGSLLPPQALMQLSLVLELQSGTGARAGAAVAAGAAPMLRPAATTALPSASLPLPVGPQAQVWHLA
ncbi:hypothetical protein N2152v2_003261 [Parachlorella kessleri]